jgi:hypothetical protein
VLGVRLERLCDGHLFFIVVSRGHARVVRGFLISMGVWRGVRGEVEAWWLKIVEIYFLGG